MNKFEFENLSGRSVTEEQYKAIEILYMSSDLGKAEFVKSMKPMLKSIPQPKKEKDIIKPLEDKDFEDCIDENKKPIELNY